MKSKEEKKLKGRHSEVNIIRNVKIVNFRKDKIKTLMIYNRKIAELKIIIELK